MSGKINVIIRKLVQSDCRRCKALSYALDSIRDELTEHNAVVSEHDLDVENGLIRKYRVTTAPLLIFERNGMEITRLEGQVSAQEVIDAVEYAKVAP